MTQCDRIMDYLDKHPLGITQFEATSELGILRLASRISDLKRENVKIETEMIKVKNRWNEDCHVARYTLAKEK